MIDYWRSETTSTCGIGIRGILGIIDKITYRKNWKIRGIPVEYGVLIQIDAIVNDAKDQSRTIPLVSHGGTIPEYASEREILERVRIALMDLERHECDEFFRYKGVQIFDPHKGQS